MVEIFNTVKAQSPKMGIKLVNPDTGHELLIEVEDKYPQLGDVHIEGRRVVEVSIEHYMELVQLAGYYPVIPAGNLNEQDKGVAHE